MMRVPFPSNERTLEEADATQEVEPLVVQLRIIFTRTVVAITI